MRRFWSEDEDEILRKFVQAHGKQWNIIAAKLPRRTPTQIAARWEKCLNPDLIKGPFTAEEDHLILEFVEKNGPHSWPNIAKLIPARSPKQCRERWFNHLNPNVLKSAWSYHEDSLIFDQYNLHGPKWSLISKMLPGRTDNAVKNRWHSSLSKRIKMDSNGKQTLLHDTSKRNHHKQMESLRPPPLVTPSSQERSTKSSPEKTKKSNKEESIIGEPLPGKKSDEAVQAKIDEKPIYDFPEMTFMTPSLFSPEGMGYDRFNGVDVMMSPFSPHNINSIVKSESFELIVSPTKLVSDQIFSPIRPIENEFDL